MDILITPASEDQNTNISNTMHTETPSAKTPKNVPPENVWRNEYGLMENVQYVYDENGFVNWRKMIPLEFLTPNAERTDEKDVTKLQDKDLIILLGGLKYLAQLRGYTMVSHNVIEASATQVTVVCSIHWMPNYETSGEHVVFSAIAEANLSNTKGFGQNFLGSIAENRAFCRAVRNFLKINIVSADELGPDKNNPENETTQARNSSIPSEGPYSVLSKLMEENKIDFEKIQKRLIDEKFKNAEKFQSIQDIPILDVYKIIERIKNKKNKSS